MIQNMYDTAEIRKANRKHILERFEDVQEFIEEVDNAKHVFPHVHTVYGLIIELIRAGIVGEVYTADRTLHLNRLGFNMYSIENMFEGENSLEITHLYECLLARDGERLYNQITKEESKEE